MRVTHLESKHNRMGCTSILLSGYTIHLSIRGGTTIELLLFVNRNKTFLLLQLPIASMLGALRLFLSLPKDGRQSICKLLVDAFGQQQASTYLADPVLQELSGSGKYG
ncbi:hypothetical protein [Sphaerochaeta sp. PS]|uniref:hypothetical protein n=1 Tax=Sphaerochaeta sp. PS TaxID=3076336 RepID=UPI0028A4D27A|nr:hypothetical protein [Sphaerochaeta sp. PS]MDT4762300.1 hypothetical protein [Sphaerochaeta sp. PS]